MAVATKSAPKKTPTKVKLQPLGDRIVIEREEAQETTAGGILLPDTAKDKPARGTVLAIGDGKLNDDGTRSPVQVKVGDRVLFTSYAPQEIEVGDISVLLLSERDILAVIED